MTIWSSIIDWTKPPCVTTTCVPRDHLPPDPSLREKTSADEALSPYGVRLKQEDEANGLFVDEDCYLFTGDPEMKTYSLVGRYWLPSSCLFLGVASLVLKRVMERKPIRAGGTIWKIPLTAWIGWVAGRKLQDYINDYTAERDAQFLHYCRLHPEDFPRKRQVLYRDYLAPWYPIR